MKSEVAACLLHALCERPAGRRTWVELTGMTESTVRTHLNGLWSRRWVTFAKAGTHMTSQGRAACRPLLEAVQSVACVRLQELGIDQPQCAAHLRGVPLPTAAWALRDRAIQAGARGALLLLHVGRLVFSDTQEALGVVNPTSERLLLDAFPSLQPKDAIVIAFADRPALAAAGLWRMVVELVPLPGFPSWQ